MARLLTSGFECQRLSSDPARDPEGQGFQNSGGSSATAVKRSGNVCAQFAAGSVKSITVLMPNQVRGRNYFLRTAIRFATLPPTNNFKVVDHGDLGTFWDLRMTTAGNLILRDSTGATLGGANVIGGAVAGTWYVVEVKWNVATDGTSTAYEVRVDGASRFTASGPGGSGVAGAIVFGQVEDSGNCNVQFDDFALNDDQGATSQTSWPGLGKVVFLKPDTDSSLGNWTGGAGGTSDLSQAVDNTPPVGVAVGASSTDATQIENPTNALSNYVCNLFPYTTAVASGGGGMATTDQMVLCYPIGRFGNSTTTSRNTQVTTTNPSTLGAGNTAGLAAGTEPTGWTTPTVVAQIFPPGTVNLGTAPTLTLRKNTASTDTMTVDLGGLMVEYQPIKEGSAALAADGTAGAIPIRVKGGATAIGGESALGVAANAIRTGVSALVADGGLTSTANRLASSSAVISADGSLSAAPIGIRPGTATLSGDGALSALAGRLFLGTAAFVGDGVLTANGFGLSLGSVTLSGDGAMSANGSRLRTGVIPLTGQGNLATAAIALYGGRAVLTSSGVLVPSGGAIRYGSRAIDGNLIEAGDFENPGIAYPWSPWRLQGASTAHSTAWSIRGWRSAYLKTQTLTGSITTAAFFRSWSVSPPYPAVVAGQWLYVSATMNVITPMPAPKKQGVGFDFFNPATNPVGSGFVFDQTGQTGVFTIEGWVQVPPGATQLDFYPFLWNDPATGSVSFEGYFDRIAAVPVSTSGIRPTDASGTLAASALRVAYSSAALIGDGILTASWAQEVIAQAELAAEGTLTVDAIVAVPLRWVGSTDSEWQESTDQQWPVEADERWPLETE